jgi:arylsulfatase A-like enzyme
MDDMGWTDLNCFGGETFDTPNMDRLAKEGMQFKSFYVSQAVCGASRASLMTGCYSNRVGVRGAPGPKFRQGLHPEETTVAEICKSVGYATAMYGKWHLGHMQPHLPVHHGFDDYYGLPYSNDMWPLHPGIRHLSPEERLKRWPRLPIMEDDQRAGWIDTLEQQDELTTDYTTRSVEFIDANKDKPFFLYLAHSLPHVPLAVSKKFRGKSRRGLYGDVVMELDWSVGEVMKALDRNGIADNTLVIVTSDNGPWLNYGNHSGTCDGLREGKGTMFEGGCRVPGIMRFPKMIPAGTVTNELASTIDVLPTVAELVGAKLPEKKIDGVSLVPLISGKTNKSPRQEFWYYYGGGLEAVRKGKWKLHFPHRHRHYHMDAVANDGLPGKTSTGTIGLALYDLENDVAETKALAAKYPEIVAELKKIGDAARADLGDTITKRKGPGIRPLAPPVTR